MSERVARRDPHTAVKQELLVRYLDAWTPTVLRTYRRATYLECARDESAVTALGVFAEFADRLTGHELDVVVLGVGKDQLSAVLDELGRPAGLSLQTADDMQHLAPRPPVFAHVDMVNEVIDDSAAWTLLTDIAADPVNELLLTLPGTAGPDVTAHRERLRAAGLEYAVHVELTDAGLAGPPERSDLLVFATGNPGHLSAYKEALWAADEYAGIRYRDPRDPEGTLVDISLSPPLLPLRRVLLEQVRRRELCTVEYLQHYTLTETIYRPSDAVRVLTVLASQGSIARDPEKGRLSPRTIVRATPS